MWGQNIHSLHIQREGGYPCLKGRKASGAQPMWSAVP